MASNAIRFSRHLKELRLHLCQRSPSSQGVRDFIAKNYVPLKQANEGVPILIREASGAQPKCYARYEFGHEDVASLDNMTSSQVKKVIEGMATAAVKS